MNHPLAPDEVILEVDPWGSLRTYARFGEWTIETRTFDTGQCCSVADDVDDANAYRDGWLATGREPDMGSEPRSEPIGA